MSKGDSVPFVVRLAPIAEILMLILFVPQILLEFYQTKGQLSSALSGVYTFGVLVMAILYIIYMYGFVKIGVRSGISQLRMAGIYLIAINVAQSGMEISDSFVQGLFTIQLQVGAVILVGVGSCIFGFGLTRLRSVFGSLATWSGWMNIIAGASFIAYPIPGLTMLAAVGFILVLPIAITEIVLLLRCATPHGWSALRSATSSKPQRYTEDDLLQSADVRVPSDDPGVRRTKRKTKKKSPKRKTSKKKSARKKASRKTSKKKSSKKVAKKKS